MESEWPKKPQPGNTAGGGYRRDGGCQHRLVSNSSGCGTGRVEVWCVLCGAQEIYYDDTGTVLYSSLDPGFDNSDYAGVIHSVEELNASIRYRHKCEEYADEQQVCLICGKQIGAKEPEEPVLQKTAVEKLYIVEKRRRGYSILGFEERAAAEANGLLHLTVIIVPFITDGPEKGQWIVHDRTAKLWAKGKTDVRSPSLNLFGGHCSVAEEQGTRTGEPVTREIFDSAAERELGEELLCRGSGRYLEVWKSKGGPSSDTRAAQYTHAPLIPIGIVTCNEANNREASFLYALPVPSTDADALIAADNYLWQGVEQNIALPILRKSETELRALHKNNPEVEICDAITRLWRLENSAAHRRLQRAIRSGLEKKKRPRGMGERKQGF